MFGFQVRELLEVMESADDWAGFNPIRGRRPKDWPKRMAAAICLLENHRGWSKRAWAYRLEEASTTSDFPYLLGDVIDRKLVAAYQAQPHVMRRIVRVDPNVPNFNIVRRKTFDAFTSPMQKVRQEAGYEKDKPEEGQYTYKLDVWGKLFEFTWQSYINDDLGALDRIPEGLAQSAAATEELFLTKLFFNSAGPLDTYFAHSSSKGQNGVSALPLLIANLEACLQEMTGSKSNGTDYTTGRDVPVANNPAFLVIPPALKFTAQNIMASAGVQWTLTGSTDVTLAKQATANTVAQAGLEILVNPYIPYVVTTGTLGQTSWSVFSNTIPAAELGLLAGHSSPELFLKTSNAQTISGGGTNPFDGDFENDTIAYKGRHSLGGATLDPRGGWASDGQ